MFKSILQVDSITPTKKKNETKCSQTNRKK